MCLRILDPGSAGFVRARVTLIFMDQDKGRMVMANLARWRVDGVLQVGHDLVYAGCQRFCLAVVDHLGKIIDRRIATRRLKPDGVGQGSDPHHRRIIEISK